jgi:hypothetical protein
MPYLGVFDNLAKVDGYNVTLMGQVTPNIEV